MLSNEWLTRHHTTLLIVAGVLLIAFFAMLSWEVEPVWLVIALMAGSGVSLVLGAFGLSFRRVRARTYRHLEAAMVAEPTLQRIDQGGEVHAPALAERFATCAEGTHPWIPGGVTGPISLDVLGDHHAVRCSGFLWTYRTGHGEEVTVAVRAMGLVALPSLASSDRRVVIRFAGDVSDRRWMTANVSTTGRTAITGGDETLQAAVLGASEQRLLGVSAEPRILEIRGRCLLLVDPNAARGLKQGCSPQMVHRMLALRSEAAQLAEIILTIDQLELPDAVDGLDSGDESGAAGEL